MTIKAGWSTRHQRVGLDVIGQYTVSTVKLPIMHGFDTMPLWYETMIFKGEDMSGVYMERYETEEQAYQGHLYAIEEAKILDQKDNQ